MAAREIALQIKRWAIKNGAMGLPQGAPDFDPQIINEVFRGTGIRPATAILQKKPISFIAVNEEANEITILTARSLNQRERKLLSAAGTAGTTILFEKGGLGIAGIGPKQPIGTVPWARHGGRYTCGSSVFVGDQLGAGTLGALVVDGDGTVFGLSNNHVTGGSNYATLTLPITAPGMRDVAAGGLDPFTIGHHFSAYPFVDGDPGIVDARQNIDAAIFRIADLNLVTSMQRTSHDTPPDVMPLSAGMDVQKVGRTTGLTSGKVLGFSPDEEHVTYELPSINGKKIIYYADLFAIKGTVQPFALPGDSGSLITHFPEGGARVSVGIVIATDTEGLTYALSIDRVLQYFGVRLVSAHNV